VFRCTWRRSSAYQEHTDSYASKTLCLPHSTYVCVPLSLCLCSYPFIYLQPKINILFINVLFSITSLLVTHTQPFYGSLDFVSDNLGELVPEETFTHSPIAVICYDPWYPPYSIYVPDSLFPQSLSSFLQSTSWRGTFHFIFRTFLRPIIVIFSCILM